MTSTRFQDTICGPGARVRVALLGLLLALLGCTPIVETHGHRLDDAAIAQIEPGLTSRDQVFQLLGSPSSESTFDGSAWYYVRQRTERTSFYQADIVAQDVVSVHFDPDGTVTAVERHGLEQARAIDPVDRATPTAGNELGVLEQFVGNIGRFNVPRDEPEVPAPR